MELLTSEIKVGAGDFNAACNFYKTLFNVRTAFTSKRLSLFVQNNEYLLIESVEDNVAATLPTQVITIKCENLYNIAAYFSTLDIEYELVDTHWDTFLLVADPAGHICQFKESVTNKQTGIAA